MRVAVLTISDAGARGERPDTSGDAVAEWAVSQGATVVARALVPDDTVEIVRCLLAWCDGEVADLVLTTGGTGLSERDVTPEATRAVIEREATGVTERLRGVTGATFPRASLSRGVCGVRFRTLIVNLPGSTSARATGPGSSRRCRRKPSTRPLRSIAPGPGSSWRVTSRTG